VNFLIHPNQPVPVPMRAKEVFCQQKKIAVGLKKMSVRLLILHGSVAQGQSKTLSDVDFAVLFKNDSYKMKDVAVVQGFLSKILERDDIDLAVLNGASPLLCMQVLRKGQVIYEDNSKSFFHFRERTILRYLRTKYLRTQFHQYQKQAVLGKA
jgi:predicted nucleotidyltransferase